MLTLAIIMVVAMAYTLATNKNKIGSEVLTKDRCLWLKALLPFFIVLCHISRTYGIMLDFKFVGPYVVGLFFFISGYGLAYKHTNGKLLLRHFPRRIYKLIMPTLVPLVAYYALLYASGRDVINAAKQELMFGGVLLPYTWFVLILLILNAAYYVAQSKCKAHTTHIEIAMFVIITLLAIFLISINAASTLFTSNYAFLLGIWYQHHEKNILFHLRGRNGKYIILLSMSVLIGSIMAYSSGKLLFRGLGIICVTIYNTLLIMT